MEIKEESFINNGIVVDGALTVTARMISWKSRRRSAASGRNLDKVTDDSVNGTAEQSLTDEKMEEANIGVVELSERRKALFEPLEPSFNTNGKRLLSAADSLLPPPDFDSAGYPKGWLVGKKRKLVNVDVVESMRRIAVHEMNRKDREIDGLNEQLEEDARCMEHLQVQLLQEKSKRAEAERENSVLKDQISMLMSMLDENEAMADKGEGDEEDPGRP